MGEGPTPPHTVPHGFWAGREISTLGHAGGWVREQGKARTRLSAGQRRLTSGQQVWGCQGSQDVHVPSQGSSSAQLREPRAGDGARRAWGEGAATPAASEGARWRPASQRGRRTKRVCRTRRACARSPSLPPRPEAAPGTGAPRGCLGAGRGAGGSGSGDRRQFVGAHPHTWEVRARWCVQRARDGSRELGPQGCGNRRRGPNGRRASDKCPRRVAGPSSPPGRRRAARGAPAECRSRGPWRGRAGASPCRVPARPPRGFLSAQHVPRRAHALSPVLSSARRGSRLPPCRVPSSQHGAWRHRWPAGLDSRSGRRVDGAALSASRRSSRLFQNANSCPVDRTVFKCICIRACYGGKILKKVSVRAAPPGLGLTPGACVVGKRARGRETRAWPLLAVLSSTLLAPELLSGATAAGRGMVTGGPAWGRRPASWARGSPSARLRPWAVQAGAGATRLHPSALAFAPTRRRGRPAWAPAVGDQRRTLGPMSVGGRVSVL